MQRSTVLSGSEALQCCPVKPRTVAFCAVSL